MLSPEDIASLGNLPREAIAGFLLQDPDVGEQLAPEHVRLNPAFIQFMHQVIQRFGPDDPSLQVAAKQQQDGWLYIIGAFQVQRGQIARNTYWANEKHLLYSEHGLVRLPSFLHEALVRELKQLKPT
ncbi:MAG: hypothetical protein H0T73_16730 [Ardenticatenales bacterium]|nr:hypothetical protein [Ardenticatenales bacterium]